MERQAELSGTQQHFFLSRLFLASKRKNSVGDIVACTTTTSSINLLLFHRLRERGAHTAMRECVEETYDHIELRIRSNEGPDLVFRVSPQDTVSSIKDKVNYTYSHPIAVAVS